jgi:pimeloyl-ACP methyl ester carboxylesterase
MKNFAKVLALAVWGLAAAAWAKPDLVISSITLSTNKALDGTKINIKSVTRNNGDATGWWKYCDVYYYWGTKSGTTNNATCIGTGVTPNYQEVNGIDKYEEEEDELGWTIPAGTTPGIYYITCVADAEKEISESNETNNMRSVKFTVVGTPSFANLRWSEPKYVSGGDPVTLYGECPNIPKGSNVTVQVYEDDPLGDDLMATYSLKVREAADGTTYFTASWTAVFDDDASGDPEYYFKVTYKQDGKTYTAESGQNDGAFLHVSNDRMTPSYDWSGGLCGGFYYDNVSTNDPGFRGPTSGTGQLTDDRIPIILVHGMSGDAKPSTLNYWYGWMNADTSTNTTLGYFNQAPMSNMFRVYRYVYDSRDFISTNGARFAKFVNDFYDTHPAFSNRQVVVMAHSMGGLVSRYAMNSNPQFAKKVHRLVTLGSPHLGAQGANPTWIKYSGPDDNSWFVSGIYNTFDLHNNTAGCFDLAWYATNEIPTNALTQSAINEMGDSYNTTLLAKSLSNPFTGWPKMRSTNADPKCVLFGGSSTNQISDYLSKNWPSTPSKEVKTDHLGLWVATKIYRSMSYRDGSGVGDNDGLVPLISALMNDSLKCAQTSDRNAHPLAVKYNLNALEGQQVDHASYLDVPVTMDSVKAVLLTQVRGYCQQTNGSALAGAMWSLIDNVTGETSPWQKSSVRLPALVAGRSYTVQFSDVSGYSTPAKVTFTATKAVTRIVRGTYVKDGGNHPPTGLALGNTSVPENAPTNTLVGVLSAYDEDGDRLEYRLVDGEGATGNACFSIVGNELRTAQVFDFETAKKHYCRIRVSDTNNAFSEEAFTIDVLDMDETKPGEATGDAWLNLSWEAVPGAAYYEVNVAAEKDVFYTTPDRSLGSNKFLSGQHWRYEAPGGATTTAQGSVKTSPCWFTYGTTNAHALFGTNGMALVTENLPLEGSRTVSISFQNANWNGGGTAAVSRVDVSYSVDGGATWTFIGYNQSTAPRDGGETNYASGPITLPADASTVAFKLSAPNARRDTHQRGPYVTTATAGIHGQGFLDADYRVEGYPRFVNTTNLLVQRLPADTPYWWQVRANVDGEWVEAGYGHDRTVDSVPAPTGLSVATASSTELTATWTDPGAVDHFEVELTPVVAAGTPKDISMVPNEDLGTSANTSGWFYSANHAATGKTWFFKDGSSSFGHYHALMIEPVPGIQSPVLDLSGYESASLRFVARTRGVTNNVQGESIVLFYRTGNGENWVETTNSVATNSVFINNNNFLTIDLPPETLVDGVQLELCVPGATGTGTVYGGGKGAGIRNVTLLGVGKAAPDYDAETAIALDPVPSPLANAVEASPTATVTAGGLTMGTNYWVHVRAVDAWGHASAWVEASGTTAAASAPASISLSGRSIRENNAVGAYIGQLSAEDPDAGDEVTYSLADGEGADDNALVELSGATVRAAASFKASDAAVRRIRVRATDAQGLWTEQAFDIEVLASATPPAGVVVDAETLAAMSAACGVRIVAVEGDGEGRLKTAWEDAATAGARAVRKYDIYVSTNLLEGFTFLERVEGTEATVPLDGPARFWTVLTAE